ncbi:uncharacterized protein LOC133800161 [Humulus lupulus]|uniref:uncharacterized protein LOC133800161 n=1 Tax=Humulus lupulus TaxID=3486 RepID=UPI002B4014C8|nr:uncharacterized protein LOC133800161 [Humulus lupulus]
MNGDVMDYIKKCDKFQRFTNIPRAPPKWPFAVWGIDLMRPYAIVVVDYFTKWVEAKPLATITSKKALDFVIKNIVFQYGLPRKIVSANGLQLDSKIFTNFCQWHGFINSFSSVAHLQANG